MARMAASRPGPGPFTNTSSSCHPRSVAVAMAAAAAVRAANGVLLREPLKPEAPALPHTTALPCGSVMVMMVLLKVACTCAWPCESVRLALVVLRAARASLRAMFLLLLLGAPASAAPGDGLLGALARARVGAGALPARRQTAPVAQAAITADVNQPFDVHLDFAAQVALHHVVLADVVAQGGDLRLGQVFHPGVGINPRRGYRLPGTGIAHPVDVGQPDDYPSITWQVYAFNTRHDSSLSLLVARVLADHKDFPAAPHDLAFRATLAYRR